MIVTAGSGSDSEVDSMSKQRRTPSTQQTPSKHKKKGSPIASVGTTPPPTPKAKVLSCPNLITSTLVS